MRDHSLQLNHHLIISLKIERGAVLSQRYFSPYNKKNGQKARIDSIVYPDKSNENQNIQRNKKKHVLSKCLILLLRFTSSYITHDDIKTETRLLNVLQRLEVN